jgi:hypothetical protein
MPTVRLEITPDPAQVRTARLVAVAMARRAGVSEGLLDEVRLAVGEACSRAVGLHRSHGIEELIRLDLVDAPGFAVTVHDSAPDELSEPDAGSNLADALENSEGEATGSATEAELTADIDALDPEVAEGSVTTRMRLALLEGLVDEVEVGVAPGGSGTWVRMAWSTD